MIKNFFDCLRVFDGQYYESQYSDVKNYKWGSLIHAIRFGIRENRSISPWINPDFYIERYPESQLSGLSATEHYLRHGWKSGNLPGPDFDPRAYLAMYPDVASWDSNPLLHFIKFGIEEGRLPRRAQESSSLQERRTVTNSGDSVEKLIRGRWLANEPLRLFHNSGESPRVHVVTDSFGPESLFGGVATSTIFAAILAEKLQFGLCLITRHNPNVDLGQIKLLLEHFGVKFWGRLDHEHMIPDSSKVLATNTRDVFLGTSWWTTSALLSSVIPESRIIYILQEDEREFYPSGDDRLRATSVMCNAKINVVVNTAGLMDYLIKNGIPELEKTGLSFEPSFNVYSSNASNLKKKTAKKRLFFYARPNNHRNLFFLGMEALDRAILEGVIDKNIWDVVLVGKDLPEVCFSDGTLPLIAGNQSFMSYRKFIQTFDAGFSLMATPHPSYPPLDLAASGVPVLTNTWPGKPNLSIVSPLIKMANPNVEDLVDGLSALVKQAKKESPSGLLKEPYSRSWQENFEAISNHFVEQLGD